MDTDAKFQRQILVGLLSYHKRMRMFVATGDEVGAQAMDIYQDALEEAIRCFDVVHGEFK